MKKKIQTSNTNDKNPVATIEAKAKPVAPAKKEQPKAERVVAKANVEVGKEAVKNVAPLETPKVEAENIVTKSPARKKRVVRPSKKEVPPIVKSQIQKEEAPIPTVPTIDEPNAILDIAPQKPVVAHVQKKSAEQLKYEKEAEQFENHIKQTCEYWESHVSHKSHCEKHDITKNCNIQGIDVKFQNIDEDTTNVTFSKGRTSFSFQTKNYILVNG